MSTQPHRTPANATRETRRSRIRGIAPEDLRAREREYEAMKARLAARNAANGANAARAAQRACSVEEPKVFQGPEVSEETQPAHDSQVSEDFEDSYDSQDSQDTQDTKTPTRWPTPLANPMANPMANSMANKLDKKTAGLELVELGIKYSKSFNERNAFYLAANVKALELRYGKFPLELRLLAYDAATETIKPEKRDALLKTYLSAFKKIETPMTDNLIVTALSNVADMGLRDLPEIPGRPLACEVDRRILALHQQMHVLTGRKDYFLSRRSMQEVAPGKMNRYDAINACGLLEAFGLIEIVDRGTPRKGTGKGAARYRYIGDSDEIPF